MFLMSCHFSVIVGHASFKKISEMTKVKSFGYQLQISKWTTLLEMSVKFYAVLSLFSCMVLVLYLFIGPLLGQKSSNVFSKTTIGANFTSALVIT